MPLLDILKRFGQRSVLENIDRDIKAGLQIRSKGAYHNARASTYLQDTWQKMHSAAVTSGEFQGDLPAFKQAMADEASKVGVPEAVVTRWTGGGKGRKGSALNTPEKRIAEYRGAEAGVKAAHEIGKDERAALRIGDIATADEAALDTQALAGKQQDRLKSIEKNPKLKQDFVAKAKKGMRSPSVPKEERGDASMMDRAQMGTLGNERELQQAIVGEPSERAIDMVRGHPDIPSSRYANDDRIIEALLGRKPITTDAGRANGTMTAPRNTPGVRGETNPYPQHQDLMASPEEAALLKAERSGQRFTPADDILQELAPSQQGRYYERPLVLGTEGVAPAKALGGDLKPGVPIQEDLFRPPRSVFKDEAEAVDNIAEEAIEAAAPGQRSFLPETVGVRDWAEMYPEAAQALGDMKATGMASRLPVRGMRPGSGPNKPNQGLSELDALLQRLTAAQ